MDAAVRAQLLQLNQQFYQTFAASFSATRQRLQPGVARVLQMLPPTADILDLGCGNGGVGVALAQRRHQGLYAGLDGSAGLLQLARQRLEAAPDLKAEFLEADLATADWDASLAGLTFDVALAFAVLHHLPGADLRRRLVSKIYGHLKPGGLLALSCWQFLNSPRLQERIRPWSLLGLTEQDVEPGDYLMDWKRDGYGMRYVHHFNAAELRELAAEAGFAVQTEYLSDGEGGRLGLYQVWIRAVDP